MEGRFEQEPSGNVTLVASAAFQGPYFVVTCYKQKAGSRTEEQCRWCFERSSYVATVEDLEPGALSAKKDQIQSKIL